MVHQIIARAKYSVARQHRHFISYRRQLRTSDFVMQNLNQSKPSRLSCLFPSADYNRAVLPILTLIIS